jgi:prolyl oligopeptidase
VTATPSVPPARREIVTKTVGGITFDDPYAWLREDSPEALEWQWRQDAAAREVARSWEGYERLKQEILGLPSTGLEIMFGPPRKVGGRWFRMDASPEGAGQALFMSPNVNRRGIALVDTVALSRAAGDGKVRMLMWWEPSPDGAYVAFVVGVAGDMTGTWRVVETAGGRLLPLVLPALGFTGVHPGWLPDGSGFFLQDRSDEGHHRIRFIPVLHGAAARPDVVLSPDLVPATAPGLTPQVSPSGRWAVGVAQPHEHIAYVIGDLRTGLWRRFLPAGFRGECDGAWLDDDTYVARVHDVPRGRVVAIPVATSTDATTWRELVPESEAVLRAATVVEQRIVLCELKDVSVRYRILHLDGTPDRIVPLEGPGSSRIALLIRRFEPSEALTLDFDTFARASTRYRYDVRRGRLTVIGKPGRSLADLTVKQRFATSKDGTQVPYFVVHRKGLDLSIPQPALVVGYGGFNVPWLPMFLGQLAPFVEAGGVYIHANLRGGAEYGPEWHDAGRLTNKQNTFDDLFAVTEDVIAAGMTRPDRLAMHGASNGGLLAGVAIVQRPDLWRVVAPCVPLFDQMEPFLSDPSQAAIAAFWLQDYGDPRDPEMAKVLYSYSPYHNIKDGTAYPAVFQMFGEKDLGCLPFHGRKFTARLQAASSSGLPILLRVWRDVGHGAADTETAASQTAEWLGFVMRELGMTV